MAFRFSDEFQQKHPDIRQKWIQTLLRTKGWYVAASVAQEVLPTRIFRIVPNYDLPPDLSQVDILRVVVKENFTEALLDRLVADIVRIREVATAAYVHVVNRSRSQKTSSTKPLPCMPSVHLASTPDPVHTNVLTDGLRITKWKAYRGLAPIRSPVKRHAPREGDGYMRNSSKRRMSYKYMYSVVCEGSN